MVLLTLVVFASAVWSGIVLGSAFALLATGLTMIFATARILNFTHGAFFMWGAYIVWWLSASQISATGGFVNSSGLMLPFIVSVFIAFGALFLFGSATERAVLRPLRNKPGWMLITLFATMVLAGLWEKGTLLTFGPRPKTYIAPLLPQGTITLGDLAGELMFITYAQISIFAVAVTVLLLLRLFLKANRHGLAMRAIPQDRIMATLCGVKVFSMYVLTFGLSAVLAGLSGILLLVVIDPNVGFGVTWLAFIIVIFGGIGSVTGTIYASFIIGLIIVFTELLLGTTWAFPLELALILLVLAFRPRGLLGQKE